MPFRITLAEGSWSTDDLTLSEVIAIEEETGDSWIRMNPLRSAVQARAIMRQFLLRSRSVDDAAREVDGMRVVDAVAAIDVEESDDRPKQHVDGVPQVDPKAGTGGSGTT